MLPALLFYLLKKYKHILTRQKLKLLGLIILFLSLLSIPVFSQQPLQKYTVLYKGEKVGEMQIQQKMAGDTTHFKMISDVKMRMVISIHVVTLEESSFNRDKMLHSSVIRKVHGSPKVNRQTRSSENKYLTFSDGKPGPVNNEMISYNLTRLYCMEPVNHKKVYSDAFQQFLTIQQLEKHKYKITLPDGNYNYYYYQNGICNKVEIYHSFYTLQMILN